MNEFENVDCKMAAIFLFQVLCINCTDDCEDLRRMKGDNFS